MRKNPNYEKNLANLTDRTVSQATDLDRIERHAIANFRGQFEELESALGMLRIGHNVGWKPLLIIHSRRTIRKYEEILGIKIRDVFPEVGPMADRSAGYKIAKTFSNFWKAVSGEKKVDDRRVMTD